MQEGEGKHGKVEEERPQTDEEMLADALEFVRNHPERLGQWLKSYSPERYPEETSDEAISRPSAEFIQRGLLEYQRSDEYQAYLARVRERQEQINAQQEQERTEAAAVMSEIVTLLDTKGVTGNLLLRDPQMARQLIRRLRGCTDSEDASDEHDLDLRFLAE